METLEHVRTELPTLVRLLNPKVPEDLEVICLKCLAKEPNERYASAADLADDLERFLKDEPIEARLPGIFESAFRAVLRQRFPHAAAWGWILLWSSALQLVGHGAELWTIVSDQSDSIGLIIGILRAAWVPLVIWFGLRGCRLGTDDYQLMTYAITLIMGIWLLRFLPSDADPATFEILQAGRRAILTGCLLFVVAARFWGGLYFVGIGWLIVALVINSALQREWVVVISGLYVVSVQFSLGLYLWCMGQPLESKND